MKKQNEFLCELFTTIILNNHIELLQKNTLKWFSNHSTHVPMFNKLSFLNKVQKVLVNITSFTETA